jgi:uncharacterized membrane protein
MWWILALICAFLTGIGDAVSKHLLTHAEEKTVGWGRLVFAWPWLMSVWLVSGRPQASPAFWAVAGGMVPIELVAYLSYLRAIRISPLSLTIPFLALTPMMTILTGWVLLGEKIGWVGWLGVMAVTMGAYLIHLDRLTDGWLQPIRAIWSTPGIRWMVLTALLYSITAVLGKKAIQLSSPVAFPFFYITLDAMAMTSLVHWDSGGIRVASGRLLALWPVYLLAGGLLAGAFLTHAWAILEAPVAYFISVKRLSLVVGVVMGRLIYREEAFWQRVGGTLLMVLGAALISLWG